MRRNRKNQNAHASEWAVPLHGRVAIVCGVVFSSLPFLKGATWDVHPIRAFWNKPTIEVIIGATAALFAFTQQVQLSTDLRDKINIHADMPVPWKAAIKDQWLYTQVSTLAILMLLWMPCFFGFAPTSPTDVDVMYVVSSALLGFHIFNMVRFWRLVYPK